MLARSVVALLLFILGAGGSAAHAMNVEEASRDPRWLRLFQYKKKFGHYRSPVNVPVYFFSGQKGMRDPAAEMAAAIEAYTHLDRTFGIQKQPAACVFPARKRVLEALLGKTFTTPPCPDLTDWIERLGADRAHLVFVGAFSGNPASILGHTFLRLSNSARENTEREGIDLLSYAVGFTAHGRPGDNRMTYMLKGLTGGYPGFYEIEPHYMKVGLYNNSESRDLWDLPLKLTPAETELLALHLYELTFNASMGYYFIDENCSYRLLTWLEAVKPDLDVSRKLSAVVLPAETVRVLIDSGLAEDSPRFRASIQRRMHAKLARLDGAALATFERAKDSLADTLKVSDPNIVSALLDYWIYTNYKVQANLPEREAAIMEATYQRASTLPGISGVPPVSEAELGGPLRAPFEGHRPGWAEAFAGAFNEHFAGGLRYRSGVHPLWSADPAYAETSAIEYLGADIEWREGNLSRWNLLLVDAHSLEEGFGQSGRLSWMFDAKAFNDCRLCGDGRIGVATVHAGSQPAAQIRGGAGWTHRWRGGLMYGMAMIAPAVWGDQGMQAVLPPGLGLGVRLDFMPLSLLVESSRFWWRADFLDSLEGRLTWLFGKDTALFARSSYSVVHSLGTDTGCSAGVTRFF